MAEELQRKLTYKLKSENERMNLWVHALECIGDDLADPDSLLQMASDVAVKQLLAQLKANPGDLRKPMEIVQWYLSLLEREGLIQENNISFLQLEAGRLRMEVGQGCPYALTCLLSGKSNNVCKRVLTFISVIRESIAREFDYVLVEGDPTTKCTCELFPASKPRAQLFTKNQVLSLLRIFTDEMERLQEGSVEKTGRRYAQGLTGDLQACLDQFGAGGLGKLELEQLVEGNQQAIFKGAELLQGVGRRSTRSIDEFTRGFLAGVVSRLCGAEINCEEISCVAKGDNVCRFVVTPVRAQDNLSLTRLKTVPVRLGYLSSLDHLILPIAQELLFPNCVGIEVNLKSYSFWRDLNQAIIEGEVEGGFMMLPTVLSLQQQGILLKVVCLGHRNGSGFVVGQNYEQRRQQLRENGERLLIATPSKLGTENLFLHQLMQQNNLPFRTVTVPSTSMTLNLKNNEIDGYVCSEPFITLAEKEGIGRLLVSSYEFWPNYPCCALVVNQGFFHRHPDTVKELGRELEVAGDIIENDRLWASKIAARYFNLSDEIAHNCLLGDRKRILYTNLKPGLADLETIQKLLLNTGLMHEPVALSDLLIR